MFYVNILGKKYINIIIFKKFYVNIMGEIFINNIIFKMLNGFM